MKDLETLDASFSNLEVKWPTRRGIKQWLEVSFPKQIRVILPACRDAARQESGRKEGREIVITLPGIMPHEYRDGSRVSRPAG